MNDAAAQLDRLRDEAARCTACPLYADATQTVFGEGPADAPAVFVGEVPGDRENRAESEACHPWLEAELRAVQPLVVVVLGVTAATSLMDRSVVLRDVRGRVLEWSGPGELIVTVHPSSVLRAERGDPSKQAYDAFVADLAFVRDRLAVRT